MTLSLDWAEHAARAFEPDEHKWATPGELARELNPQTIQTPALDLIDAELVRMRDEPNGRLIITMAPQEGKSLRVAKDFPTWWLRQRPEDRIVVASYGQGLANRNGKAIRLDITEHPSLGMRVAPDSGAAHDWRLEGHRGGVYSVGIGGGLTGRPAELVVIDDPIKDPKEAESETFRENVWAWWTGVVAARLAPGAPVVLILTRWHEDDLAGRLLAEDGSQWRVLNIPAQADHDPAKGETDVLGREPSEYMISTRGRTREGWELRRREAGPRNWQAQYQGRPSPPEGGILQRHWWQRYEQTMWVVRDDGTHIVPGLGRNDTELVQSWDMTFKDTKGSDFVVGQVWLRHGANVYLLDQIRDRMAFEATCRAVRMMTARWPQAVAKFVEDTANGPAVINALSRTVPGMIPIEPEGSKYARASAVSPLVQAGNVWVPSSEIAPFGEELVEECAAFPNAVHDDQVDAFSQAVNRLLLMPLQQTHGTADDLGLFDDDDSFSLM